MISVERKLFRNSQTISAASSVPSTRCALERLDHLADEQLVVLHDVQLQAGRQLRADVALDALACTRSMISTVLVLGTLTMPMPTAGLPFSARQLAEVGQAVLDLGDVAQPHRGAVLVADDHRRQVVELVELQVELDQVLGGCGRPGSRRTNWMCSRPKRVGDVLRGDAVGGHPRRQQVDADGAVAPAADAHLAHAVDGLELLLDDVDARTG